MQAMASYGNNHDYEIVMAPGCVIHDRYMIRRVLGEGGMALVYEADRLSDRSLVAIKVLRREYAEDPAVIERFKREARALEPLRSRAVARVLEVGSLGDAGPYLVMERLRGNDLAHELELRGRLPIGEAAHLVFQICEAMREAHQNGIIHRDLKPENIFLHRAPFGTQVKVLDFGISKFHNENSLTGAQTRLGTPLYMSPEQIRSTKTVDHRSDIWSLGIILYELVCGTTPFPDEGSARVITAIVNNPVEPPRARNASLCASFEAVVMKALAKNPEDRFASAEEMAKALIPFVCASDNERVCELAPTLDSGIRPMQVEGALPATVSNLGATTHVLALFGWAATAITTLVNKVPHIGRKRGAALGDLAAHREVQHARH